MRTKGRAAEAGDPAVENAMRAMAGAMGRGAAAMKKAGRAFRQAARRGRATAGRYGRAADAYGRAGRGKCGPDVGPYRTLELRMRTAGPDRARGRRRCAG